MQYFEEEMNKTKISVIIPTYRPKEYLWECLESIDGQTLDHRLFEVIIVLNGDRNPYFENIDKKLKSFSFQYTLLWHPQKGVSNARNIALEKVEGLYVCFIDDDDWVSETYLEGLLDKAIPDGIVASNVIAINEKTHQPSYHYLSKAYSHYNEQHATSVTRNYAMFSAACCKLIPMTVIGSTTFDTTLSRSEDALFMFTISKNVREIKTATETSIYYIRKRTDSSSRTKTGYGERLIDFMRLTIKFTREYVNHPTEFNCFFYLSKILGLFKNRFIPNKSR